jgi:hypothetical protein
MKNWLIYSISGLIFTGMGLCFLGEAILAKASGEDWFWHGTVALTTFNTGLSLFGQGVIERIRMLRLKD